MTGESCARHSWCVKVGKHYVCDGPDLGEDLPFVVYCGRSADGVVLCREGVRTLLAYRDEAGLITLDDTPDQLITDDDNPVDFNRATPGERMLAQLSPDRHRYVFECEHCGNRARSRGERLASFIAKLIESGTYEASLAALRRYAN